MLISTTFDTDGGAFSNVSPTPVLDSVGLPYGTLVVPTNYCIL